MTNTQEHATWGELLHNAVHMPGKLLAAFQTSSCEKRCKSRFLTRRWLGCGNHIAQNDSLLGD